MFKHLTCVALILSLTLGATGCGKKPEQKTKKRGSYGALQGGLMKSFAEDLKTGDRAKKIAACKEMVNFDAKAAVPLLEEAAKDKDPEVAKTAKQVLAQVKK